MRRSTIALIAQVHLLWPLFVVGGEPERPRIVVSRPRDHFQATGEVVAYGTVAPALKGHVEVQPYHVEVDGQELLEPGAPTPLLKGGEYRTTRPIRRASG
jgi:hypothetical protein